MSSDEERQADEIFALQCIYESTSFRSIKKEKYECAFFIDTKLMNENLSIINNEVNKEEVTVEHLPPIRFYVKLPSDYPSKSAPTYSLAINWLAPWEISLVCQKLDALWQENDFNEILFNWSHFLKNELLCFLNVKETLDITYLYNVFIKPDDEFIIDVLNWCDKRIIYAGIFLDPIEKLKEHDKIGKLLEFNSSLHNCEICFVSYVGSLCKKITECHHVFCQNCIEQYLRVKINERNVQSLRCPAFSCNIIIKFNQIKEICSSDLFQKYEKYLLEIRQFNTKNLVYCPRKICQAAVMVKHGDSLASCLNCEYNFCAYCFKTYHGVAACDMNLEDKMKLIEEYNRANIATKKYLETKYGKHQIRQIIEKQLTEEYIKENTRVCPTCNILATKISGCNLMTCSKCHTNFCWICDKKITSEDPYDHFKSSGKGSCAGLLFEGVDVETEFDDFVEQNINMEDLMLIDELLDENN